MLLDDLLSMLAEFLTWFPKPRLVLIAYGPEHHGALSQTPGAQTIALHSAPSATAVATSANTGVHP